MKVVFLGTPDFAVPALKKIFESGHEVVAVVTQTDKPKGRHGTPVFSAVKECAIELGLPVLQYSKIRLEGVEELRKLGADIFVTCAYGQILSQEIIDIPPKGIINIHASLLPKYRGAAPIQWSIINGDKCTGVTIMRTDIGVDTGDILMQERLEIGQRERAGELFDRLSVLGGELVLKALEVIAEGKENYIPQDHDEATHVKMLKKEDGLIDWSKTPFEIDCLVRGTNPWPGAFTYYCAKMLKIYDVEVCRDDNITAPYGQILVSDAKDGIIVSAGGGSLRIKELQLEGAKRMSAEDFLRGRRIAVGELFNGERLC